MDAEKKSTLYRERDPQERAAFLNQIAGVRAEDQVYIDEAGVEDTLDFAWGWSRKGTRCLAERLGHRTVRVSMAAAWCCGEVLRRGAAAWCCGLVLAPLTFEGYCHSELVIAWFE